MIKKIIIALFVCFFVLPSFAKPIYLHKYNPYKASPIKLPVAADIDDDTRILTIQFFQDLKNVSVEVKNSKGEIVYYAPVEGVSSNETYISLANEQPGDYQLTIIHYGMYNYI